MSIGPATSERLKPLTKPEKYRAIVKLLGWLVPALLLLGGIVGGLALVIEGEEAFGTTDAVPWGLLIAAYVLLAVTCSGLCLLSSLGHVFRVKLFEVVGERAIFLAVVVLLSGFAVLAVELGHPLRLVYVLLSPNFTSGIWWMGTIYGIYLVALVVELFLLLTHRHRLARGAGMLSVALAVAATTNLGSVFGLIDARPFWYGAYWPLYILVTALMSGTAAMMLLTWGLLQGAKKQRRRGFFRFGSMMHFRLVKLNAALSKILASLLVLTAVMTVWNLITSLYGGVASRQQAALALLTGPLALPFWLFEVCFGLLLPLVIIILSKGRRQNFNLAAAGSVLLGVVFMRYDMVIAGQLVPSDLLDAASIFSGYSSYIPSTGEVAVLFGALGFIILAYRLGEYYLPLKPTGN